MVEEEEEDSEKEKRRKKIKRLAWPHCMQNGAFPAEMGVQRTLV